MRRVVHDVSGRSHMLKLIFAALAVSLAGTAAA
jgi:hypothetical protein